MSEGRRSAESHELNAAARFLMERMKAGERLDSSIFGELVGVLRSYQAGEYQQPVVRPAAFGSRVGVTPPVPPARQEVLHPASPPTPARAPVPPRETTRRTAESFLEQEPWNQFHGEVARQEFRLLSEEERSFVKQAAEILREEMFAYRIVSAKAIGANVRMYSHDYGGTDLLLPRDPQFSWDGWETYFNGVLSPAEKAMITCRPNKNFVFATSAHGLGEKNLAFLSVHLWTPANTAPVDNRSVSHQAAVFLKNARFMQVLKSGQGLYLLPFIIKTAAIHLRDAGVFFDGSFAGENKQFGQAPNPIALYIQEKDQSSVFEDVDTRNRQLAEVRYSGSDRARSLSVGLLARGQSDSVSGFRLRPWAALPKDLPRLPWTKAS